MTKRAYQFRINIDMLKLITHQNNEIFWLKCDECGTYVVAEKKHKRAKEFRRDVCPHCCGLDPADYPFRFVTPDEYMSKDYVRESLAWLENIETI